MNLWLALGTAVALGAYTTVLPCPVASNAAAIAFLARRVESPRSAILSGLLYAAGQCFALAALSAIIVAGLTAQSAANLFLDRYLGRLIGPVLVLAGMAILGLLGSSISLSLAGLRVQERARKGGLIWPPLLGMLLAVSFCPGTAGVFFGGLVPLATRQGSMFLVPLAYGLGAAGPVVATAIAISLGAGAVGRLAGRLQQAQKWATRVAGTIFIVVGIYYSLTYIFGVHLYPGRGNP